RSTTAQPRPTAAITASPVGSIQAGGHEKSGGSFGLREIGAKPARAARGCKSALRTRSQPPAEAARTPPAGRRASARSPWPACDGAALDAYVQELVDTAPPLASSA